jgi:DNA-binding NtrC family response regulator
MAAAATPVILLVDDDVEFVEGLARRLREAEGKHRVLTATSAADALAVLQEESVHLLVADYHFQGTHLTGTDLLERVEVLYPSVKRVLLTGRGKLRVLAGAINRAHVARYIAKSLPPELMTDEILKMIK